MEWRVRPKPCRFVTPSPIDAEGFDGFIDVEFALSKFGMASNPHIISNSAANRQIERELLLEIRSCKFRPKFVADAPHQREDAVAVCTSACAVQNPRLISTQALVDSLLATGVGALPKRVAI